MTISRDEDGDKWIDFGKKSGTAMIDTYKFLQRIINDINPGIPQRRRLFTMDNLLTHKKTAVVNIIVEVGHRFWFHMPYYSADGAIQYVLNTIHHDLEVKLREIKNASDFLSDVFNIVSAILNFCTYFTILGMKY